ncbi:sulfurtransferase-like selenium metabolism protein YedF [Loigolactobacillus iwatensis]|uniref:sulfurtransferase-like selenium metabolism protein YedF n=1 Tax=Loigolactobacillus iwatensis TaxID=1267156 RepID=UPI000F7EEC44|nr:sulfurtransferase-like selenium metabolism protein YedF [Loigolactobacillus iwatensis]
MEKINALGQACPIPIIRTKKALRNNDSVQIVVDSDISTQNLEKMAKQLGYSYNMQQLSKERFQVDIKKQGSTGENKETAQAAPVAVAEDSDEAMPHVEQAELAQVRLSQGYIVVVNTDIMGRGDDLGRTLLKGFINSMTEQDVLPEYMIFYNAGVKLLAKDSDSVEDLKVLADNGVKVLGCGACVNFYHLEDKLGVGDITNMFRIVELMRGSQRIVRP